MKALLDLDGVLVDFVSGAQRLHGQPVGPHLITDWDFYEGWGLTPESFWAPMGEEFWAGLDWTAEGRSILAVVEAAVGRENVCLLTSPCDTPGCVEGKVRWIRRYLPEYRRRFLVGPAKEYAAGPGRVLIDDSDANVIRFSAAGGNTVLVPRPWNSFKRSAASHIDLFVKGCLDSLLRGRVAA